LVLPPHAQLREELLNLVYEVGPTGVRVIDKGSVHQDHAVAVRGVVAAFARPARVPLVIVGGNAPLSASVDEIQQFEAEDARTAAQAFEAEVRRSPMGVYWPGGW